VSFGANIHSGIEESPQQTSIAEQNAQQFVVIDVDVVKTRCVEKIVAVYEDGDQPAMSQLPRDIVGWIEVMHENRNSK
jgi:hypothetical protein